MVIHKTVLTLASGSSIRASLLRNAGIPITVSPVRVDEVSIRESLLSDHASARDIADTLAETKAMRAAARVSAGLVLGCDQVLECDGALFSKPRDPADAAKQLAALRGRTHRLFTAAVLYSDGQPIWRHVSTPSLTMRPFTDDFLQSYIQHHWDTIRHCVGCYQVEAEGIRLFDRIEGDLFSIQGLPLLELLSFLTVRGDIPA